MFFNTEALPDVPGLRIHQLYDVPVLFGVLSLFLIFLIVFSCKTFADTKASADVTDMSRLRSGEVLHEFAHRDQSGGAIRAQILIRTPVEDIWSFLSVCEKYFVFVDGLEQCEVLEQTAEYVLVHQVADKGIFVPVQDYTYKTMRQPYTRMDFKLVEGTLKAMQGSWEFESLPEGVLVTYNMQVQPGLPVPRFIVRWAIGRSIPEMLACIRGLVDGSGNLRQKNSDLKLCPGEV